MAGSFTLTNQKELDVEKRLSSPPGLYGSESAYGIRCSHARQPQISEKKAQLKKFEFEGTIDRICGLPWERVGVDEIMLVARAYYYFSIQFRENLEIACRLYPSDPNLMILHREECNTSNLSPWTGIAEIGEAMNHDEFIRRLLTLSTPLDAVAIDEAGRRYLDKVRRVDEQASAKSISSYEDGGLARVFAAMLRVPDWKGDGQLAFKHFLEKHIEFDTNTDSGHGALSRHLKPDGSIDPLWTAFKDILTLAVPAFANGADLRR